MSQPTSDDEQRLREILDRTRFPSPDMFIAASIGGFLLAGALLIVGYRSSTQTFVLLALLAAVIGAASALEHRIWGMVVRRRFIRSAAKAGFTKVRAARFWESLDADADKFE